MYFFSRKLEGEEYSLAKRILPQLLAISYPNTIKYNITELYRLQTILEKRKFRNISGIFWELGQNCSEMLSYCSWNKQEKNCMNMFRDILTTEGYCCSFSHFDRKPNEPLYTGYNGIGTGLFLILDPMLQPVQHSSLFGSGFKVNVFSFFLN